MKAGYTDIIIVLDRSGSMDKVCADTIGGFNTFLETHKAAPGECAFTLTQFDTVCDIVYAGKKIADVPPLTTFTFVPRGDTALHDAIGRTINETGARLGAMAEGQRPERVIFVIITDGEENSSREFTAAKIKEMIEHQTKEYNWQFVFMGANQDAVQAGGNIGITKDSSLTYAGNAVGTQSAFSSLSHNTRSYRTGEVKTAGFIGNDRESQLAAGARKDSSGS